MNQQGKAAGRPAAGARISMTSRDGKLTHSEYTPRCNNLQTFDIRSLSALLDQALYQFEFHDTEARRHAAEAARHRAVLRSLQGLIGRRPFTRPGKGGDA